MNIVDKTLENDHRHIYSGKVSRENLIWFGCGDVWFPIMKHQSSRRGKGKFGKV